MKKTLSPRPRRVPLQTSLIVQFSPIYTLGGWICTGVGSGLGWLLYTMSNSDDSGMIDNLFMGYVAAGIFLILGLISLRLSLTEGWRVVRLLKSGEIAYGKLLKSEDELSTMIGSMSKINPIRNIIEKQAKETGLEKEAFQELLKKSMEAQKATEPQNVIMDYFFEFQTKQGSTHKVKHKVKYLDGDELEDEAEELVLYLPSNPDKAAVYDAIKNAPKIDGHGNFKSLPSSKLTVLIAPIIVILMNVWFLFKNFPHLFS